MVLLPLVMSKWLHGSKKQIKCAEEFSTIAYTFPESVMPTPDTEYCVRCNKHYDLAYPSQRICRIRHPADRHSTIWKYWKHCERCDKPFDMSELNRGRHNVPESGEWCLEGEHTQDEDLAKAKKWEEGEY